MLTEKKKKYAYWDFIFEKVKNTKEDRKIQNRSHKIDMGINKNESE